MAAEKDDVVIDLNKKYSRDEFIYILEVLAEALFKAKGSIQWARDNIQWASELHPSSLVAVEQDEDGALIPYSYDLVDIDITDTIN